MERDFPIARLRERLAELDADAIIELWTTLAAGDIGSLLARDWRPGCPR